MAYGEIKVDTITFTDGGVDKSISISGLVQNPTFSGNITVTGTISGDTLRGQTVSGVTVTGATATFTSGTFISLTGTTTTGVTATFTTGSFTSLTGTTTTGVTLTFTTGSFTSLTGGVFTATSGVFALGAASAPSITFTGDLNTGIYSPGADQVAISTSGTQRLLIEADGDINVDSGGVFYDATNNRLGIGTTAVTNLLHLRSDSASSVDHLYIQNRNGGASSEARIAFSNGTVDYNDNRYAYIGAVNTGAAENGNILVFATNSNGQAATERMRISQNGVVTVKNGAVAEIGTLTDGATITPNFAANCNFTVTLGGNRTIANPTNITAGQSGSIFLVQDATGSRTLSWGSYWDFSSGTAPTLSTTANAIDRIDYIVRSATSIHTVFTSNYS